jgi:hypothetical protein
MGHNVAGGVVGIQRESAGIVIAVGTQGDLFNEMTRADRGADLAQAVGIGRVKAVGKPGDVVELVRGFTGLFPHAHPEISILRRPFGIHDFGVVAMPHNKGVVDERTVRQGAAVTLGGELHVPHPNDGRGIVAGQDDSTLSGRHRQAGGMRQRRPGSARRHCAWRDRQSECKDAGYRRPQFPVGFHFLISSAGDRRLTPS